MNQPSKALIALIALVTLACGRNVYDGRDRYEGVVYVKNDSAVTARATFRMDEQEAGSCEKNYQRKLVFDVPPGTEQRQSMSTLCNGAPRFRAAVHLVDAPAEVKKAELEGAEVNVRCDDTGCF